MTEIIVQPNYEINKDTMALIPAEQLFAFPTHSPELYECHWIFYHHVRSIKPNPKQQGSSIITFKNNSEPLIVNASHYSLFKQVQRTSFCIVRFSHVLTPHGNPEWEHLF